MESYVAPKTSGGDLGEQVVDIPGGFVDQEGDRASQSTAVTEPEFEPFREVK